MHDVRDTRPRRAASASSISRRRAGRVRVAEQVAARGREAGADRAPPAARAQVERRARSGARRASSRQIGERIVAAAVGDQDDLGRAGHRARARSMYSVDDPADVVRLVVDRQDDRDETARHRSARRRPQRPRSAVLRRAARARQAVSVLVQVVGGFPLGRAATLATPQRTTRQASPCSATTSADERAEPARDVVRLDRDRERARRRAARRGRATGGGADARRRPRRWRRCRSRAEQRRPPRPPRRPSLPSATMATSLAVADRLRAPELEAPVETGDRRHSSLPEPEVDRARAARAVARDGARASASRRPARSTVRPGCARMTRDVLERVVRERRSGRSRSRRRRRRCAPASSCSDRAVADELVGAQRGERGDRVDERDEARLGQAGREPDHVLLGDADVEEAVREALGERLERP